MTHHRYFKDFVTSKAFHPVRTAWGGGAPEARRESHRATAPGAWRRGVPQQMPRRRAFGRMRRTVPAKPVVLPSATEHVSTRPRPQPIPRGPPVPTGSRSRPATEGKRRAYSIKRFRSRMMRRRRRRRSTIMSTNPCSRRNSDRWKPSGRSDPIVSRITRGPANPMRASGSAM